MAQPPRDTATRPFPGMWIAIVLLLVLGVTAVTIAALPSLLAAR